MPQKKKDAAPAAAEFHKKTAAACFNKAWDFLDKKERSREEDLQMLHEAHTSRYHWGQIGNAHNFAIGDWQISRVYAALKQPALALLFARSSFDICQENDLKDLLLSAYEGMARAHAVANDAEEARRYLGLARKELELVKDKEDHKIYAQQIDETEALIGK
jgi:hypothetical protein